MESGFTQAADAILRRATTGETVVPGVVAMVTDRSRNIYEGAAGQRTVGGDAMSLDSVFALFSTTKAITSIAALQLAERGELDLDAPARAYVPEIAELQVLEGFDEAGEPRLRAPRTDLTARHLLTHTGGCAYEFFNESYARLATTKGQPSVITGTKAALMSPLVFDPGTAWEYGANLDWVGQIVESITGKRLSEVMAERIFAPLGMTDMTFVLDDARRGRLAGMHARGDDGSLTATGMELPSPPEVDMGGHGLYGTVGDYMRFIRMWLNEGQGEHGRVLAPETVQMAVRNQLGDLKVKMLPGVIKELSNDAEFFPGQSKSWSLAFMINDEQAPTGRPAGSQGWAGLANLFYWIDLSNGYGGFWATQILPFADPTSFTEYAALETAFYNALAAGEIR